MRLPGRLYGRYVIVGVTWQVRVVSPDNKYLRDEDGDSEGATVHSKALILISSELSKERFPDVLWHEVQHAIYFQSGAQNKLNGINSDEIEETTIQIVGPAIFAFLRHNPHFLKDIGAV